MTTTRRSTTSRGTAPLGQKALAGLGIDSGVHAFRLTVHTGKGDTYGVTLTETSGADDVSVENVITCTPAQVGRVVDAVINAVKASGHTPGRLATKRDQPITLDETAGVRLALILMATQPLTSHDRIRAIVAGIQFMSVEETYYWYAKCAGTDSTRGRKALRVLLADEKEH